MTLTYHPDDTGTVRTAPSQRTLMSRLVALQARFPLVQSVALVVAVVYGSVALEGFASWPSIRSMLVLAALIALAAAGQTLTILIGGLDMSVAGFIVFGAIVVTQFPALFGVSFAVALLFLMVAAAVLGGLSGWFTNRFNAQSLVVTLAMGSIAIGFVQTQTGGVVAGGAPEWLSKMASPAATTFGIPFPPLASIAIVVTVVLWLVLGRTVSGRQLYAVGANQKAAGLSLVRTGRVWIIVFGVSALLSALVGVLLAGFAGSVDGTLGGPYLFQSIAAVIVGGTTLGGPGNFTRTILGALLLTVLNTLLLGAGFTSADQQIFYGIIIAIVVSMYGRDRRVRDRV